MEEYENALRLFDNYQKSGVCQHLIDALDTLNNIIEDQVAASQRANNLKRTILLHIDKELKSINARVQFSGIYQRFRTTLYRRISKKIF